jgi:hypothetical protein
MTEACDSFGSSQETPRAEPQPTSCGLKLRSWRFVIWWVAVSRLPTQVVAKFAGAGENHHKLWRRSARCALQDRDDALGAVDLDFVTGLDSLCGHRRPDHARDAVFA